MKIMMDGWDIGESDGITYIDSSAYGKILKDMEVFEMQVYEVIVVDTKECEILHRQEVIAEDEKTAMLELDVTEEIKRLQKKGRVKFIFNRLGGFDRYCPKVRIKEEDD